MDEMEKLKLDISNKLSRLEKLLDQQTNKKKWLKSAEVKELLGISHGTLQAMRNNGTIKFSRIGGMIYYNIGDVDKIMEENKNDR